MEYFCDLARGQGESYYNTGPRAGRILTNTGRGWGKGRGGDNTRLHCSFGAVALKRAVVLGRRDDLGVLAADTAGQLDVLVHDAMFVFVLCSVTE